MIPPAENDLLITTRKIGKEVSFAPALKQEAEILKRAEKAGFFYPVLAMKHLKALSTGLIGKNNVFIPNINDVKTNTFQKVVVFVPGIKATVERRANDSYVVTALELSDEYKSIERGSKEKPGVYTAKGTGENIKLHYKINGRITPENNRYVAIADTGYETPKHAAKEVAKRLEDMFGSDAAQQGDFDLFYSPVGSDLRGMRNYNPVNVTKSYAFAGLLADAIEQSIKHERVVWASERSGSVVLTQSLMALTGKGLSFLDQKHLVKMCWASSNPEPAYTAARQLGMLADKKILKSNSRIRASIGALFANASRARDRSDPYTWNDYAKDLSSGAMTTNNAVGFVTFIGGAALGSPVLTTIGAASGALGALQFALKTAKDRIERG